MRELENPGRVRRLLQEAIEAFELDLRGLTVLTEAASGPFVVTPILASMAGADHVIACTRDSRFATVREVQALTQLWADDLAVTERIEISDAPAWSRAGEADIVTNLGFVRPIDERFIAALRSGSAISLMCETWEYRASDLDLEACRRQGIPVLGTNESDPRLQTFRYAGLIALKLLFEAEVEVFKGRIAVIGSSPFGDEIVRSVKALGGAAVHWDPTEPGWASRPGLSEILERVDAVVVAEIRSDTPIIGGPDALDVEPIVRSGAPVIHISGVVDHHSLEDASVLKVPGGSLPPWTMSVTADVVGPRPVIDLHTAGLAVGAALVEGMERFGDRVKAENHALVTSPASGWEG